MGLGALPRHMRERIVAEREDAASSVGHESGEGGQLSPAMEGCELLQAIAPEWDPGTERLRAELAAECMETARVHKSPYSPTQEAAGVRSWAGCARLVEQRVRFLPFPAEMQDRDRFSATTAPSEVPDRHGNLFLDKDLSCTLEAGAELFLARIRERGVALRRADQSEECLCEVSD